MAMRKPLDEFTSNDWVQAAMYMNKNEYSRIRKIAIRAGLLEGGNVSDIKMNTISDIAQYHRAVNFEAMDQFNKDLRQWQTDTITALRANIAALGMSGSELSDSLVPTFKKSKYGEINRLGFSFARHGIFVYKGAQNGYGGIKGSKWSYRKKTEYGYINTSIMRETRTRSLGRLNQSKMKDRDWFNPVIEARLEQLADICTNYSDTMIIDATKIFIRR